MTGISRTRARVLMTLGAAAVAAAMIAWDHVDGGIGSHHLLAREDLPQISNAWALLVVPAIAWLASARLLVRGTFAAGARVDRRAAIGAALAFAYGASLATGFELGASAVTSALFFGILGLALVFPLYRAELALGFVLGMMITFGAVLPALFSGVFMLVSLVLHPLARRIVQFARRSPHAA